MLLRHHQHEGETQPSAALVLATAILGPLKRIEYAPLVCDRYTSSLILDAAFDTACSCTQ